MVQKQKDFFFLDRFVKKIAFQKIEILYFPTSFLQKTQASKTFNIKIRQSVIGILLCRNHITFNRKGHAWVRYLKANFYLFSNTFLCEMSWQIFFPPKKIEYWNICIWILFTRSSSNFFGFHFSLPAFLHMQKIDLSFFFRAGKKFKKFASRPPKNEKK